MPFSQYATFAQRDRQQIDSNDKWLEYLYFKQSSLPVVQYLSLSIPCECSRKRDFHTIYSIRKYMCWYIFCVGITCRREQLSKVPYARQSNNSLVSLHFIPSLFYFVQVREFSINIGLLSIFFFEDFYMYCIGSKEVRDKFKSSVCWFERKNNQVVPITTPMGHLQTLPANWNNCAAWYK